MGYRLKAVALSLAAGVAGASVDVAIVGAPAYSEPQAPATITLHYSRPTTESEKRLVLILDVYDNVSNTRLKHYVQEGPTGNGFKDAIADVPFIVTIPDAAGGGVYFKATVSPWSLNRAVVAQYKTYPIDGTFTYLWSGGGYGVTQNIYYRGVRICPKPSGNTTYCSGLAFDCFLSAYNNYNTTYGHTTINNLTSTQMESFRKIWYGVTDAEKLAPLAISSYGVGVEITDWEEAQDGDACQLWRWSTSGHNPTFISWRRTQGVITGVNYWGSQGSTNGIGYGGENFGTTSGINPSRFYLARAKKPRDQADYDWAMGQTDTIAAPTLLSTQGGAWVVE
ncbi:hypothetical protein BH09SUM1_BH09SUM1_30300 [soil metagenome]